MGRKKDGPRSRRPSFRQPDVLPADGEYGDGRTTPEPSRGGFYPRACRTQVVLHHRYSRHTCLHRIRRRQTRANGPSFLPSAVRYAHFQPSSLQTPSARAFRAFRFQPATQKSRTKSTSEPSRGGPRGGPGVDLKRTTGTIPVVPWELLFFRIVRSGPDDGRVILRALLISRFVLILFPGRAFLRIIR